MNPPEERQNKEPDKKLNDLIQIEDEEVSSSEDSAKVQQQSEKMNSSFNVDDDQSVADNTNSQHIDNFLNKLGLVEQTPIDQINKAVSKAVDIFMDSVDPKQIISSKEVEFNETYKQLSNEAQKRKSQYIYISEFEDIEYLEAIKQENSFKMVYKEIRLFLKNISLICFIIANHTIFEAIILLVILLNSIKMSLDDPLSNYVSPTMASIEIAFLVIYCVEMGIKVSAFGFVFNKGAYLRDWWNILDFTIVITSLLPYMVSISFSVSALRAIRVLRPLKTITKVKALKSIVRTLFLSFSLVMDSLYILLFVITVFAIAGTQLFSGQMKKRCMQLTTGVLSSTMCSQDSICSSGSICVKGISNPYFSIYNFDTFLWSFLSIFQTITMQGWSLIMLDLESTISIACGFYSIAIVLICEYVVLNITLAILKYKYAEVKNDKVVQEKQEVNEYTPDQLRRLKIFDKVSLLHQSLYSRYKDYSKIFVGAINFFEGETMANIQKRNSRLSIRKSIIKGRNSVVISEKRLGQLKFNLKDIIKNEKFEPKWDPKTLHFQPIKFDHIQIDEKAIKSRRNLKKELQNLQIQEIHQEQEQENNSIQDQQMSQKYDEQEGEEEEKSQHNNLNTQKLINVYLNKQNDYEEQRQLMSFNKLLKQIKEKQEPKVQTQNQFILPDLEFNENRRQNFYKTFQNLGKFGIKRNKKITIDFQELKRNKAKHTQTKNRKEVKKMTLNKFTEESQLDIKQLHLLNELEKISLKCRLFSAENEKNRQQEQASVQRILVSKRKPTQETTGIEKQELEQQISRRRQIFYKLPNGVENELELENRKQKMCENLEGVIRIPQKSQRQTRLATMIEKNKNINQNSSNMVMEINTQFDYKSKFKEIGKIKKVYNQEATEVELVKQYFTTANKVEPNRVQKKKQKYQNIEQKEQVKQQQFSTLQQQYLKLTKENEISLGSRLQVQCSAFDVIISLNILDYQRFGQLLNIQSQQYEIFIKGAMGVIHVIRNKVKLFVKGQFYDNFMLLIVILNTMVLCLNGIFNTDNSPFVEINYAFTVIFTIDAVIKIFSYGSAYFEDVMNLFDLFVVVISLVQIGISTNLSSLKSIRIFRAFRVLRVTRLIRSLSFMKVVMGVINSIITEFVYVFLLLVLFIFIYTLLGMQIFGGTFVSQSVSQIRQNFDSFFNALFCVFQVMSVENWNDIQTCVILSSVNNFAVLYLISWIFLGNWILLALLQAILLDGFDEEDNEDTKSILEEEKKLNKQLGRMSTVGTNAESDIPYTSLRLDTETGEVATTNNNQQQQEVQDYSVFIFPKTSWFRKKLTAMLGTVFFQRLTMFVIFANSMKLVLDTYIDSSDDAMLQLSSKVDTVFNIIFIIEAVLQIISKGFVFGKTSYLSSNWSRMDFFIVLVGIVDMSVTTINLSIIKMLRTLRPIRIINRNINMRIIITSLAQSIGGILNIMIIIMLIFMMFAILGINLLQGKLNYCTAPQMVYGNYGPYGVNQTQCIQSGGIWATQFINFDNIYYSMLSLYVFSTRENWPFYVFTFMDADTNGPTLNANSLLFFLFAVAFIFVSSYFFVDLLVGVLFMNFHKAESKLRPKVLSDPQINWINLQKLLVTTDPCLKLYLKPQNKFNEFFFKIVGYKHFDNFVMLCIVANIVSMTFTQDDSSQATTTILKYLNLGFSSVFIAEMILKLGAFGKDYFLSGWNTFDFFVVMASILDIVLSFLGVSGASALSFLPQIARIFRVLRLTRLLRLFKQFKGLQKLIETFIFMLVPIANGLSLIILFMFIFAILGSFLMGNILSDYSGYFDPVHNNFNYFHTALQLLFITTTGQNWYVYMFESFNAGYVQCVSGVSSCTQIGNLVFWLCYIFLSQKVFFELLALIVLDQFQSNYINQNNPLGIFANIEDDFRTTWIEKTQKYKALKVESKKLVDFVLQLRPPLGMGLLELQSKYEDELNQNGTLTPQEIKVKSYQFYMKLKHNSARWVLRMDNLLSKNYLSYHETFYFISKHAFINQFIANTTPQQLALLDEEHHKWEEQLKVFKDESKEQTKEKDVTNTNTSINPMQLMLFSQMILTAWQRYAKKKKKRKASQSDEQQNQIQEADSLLESNNGSMEEIKFQVARPQNRRQALINKDLPRGAFVPNTQNYSEVGHQLLRKDSRQRRKSSSGRESMMHYRRKESTSVNENG